jgi:DnaJ-class molecular chaperone
MTGYNLLVDCGYCDGHGWLPTKEGKSIQCPKCKKMGTIWITLKAYEVKQTEDKK